MRLLITASILTLLAFSGFAVAQKEDPGGRPMEITLTGAAEVPGPGDSDGTGTAKITLNQGQGKICYEISVSNIATATAAHIHRGVAGKAGPPVVTLKAPSESGSVKDCADAAADLIKEIRQNPANFYINVHNSE
ncbi:MAG TPA: CHRD domain-containing protein, partial [Blastocatellia bacterium]|nr:CHRD domain-containing protein [Blastocatellia bacterium]